MDPDSNRWWDWPAAFLFFIAMLVATGRLLVTSWIPHLDYVELLVALGVILGLALGKSRFSRRVAVWLAIGYTLFLIPWQLSQSIEGAVSWGERLGSVGGRLIYSLAQLYSRQPVDDFILFLTFVCILFWTISVFSGYALSRHGNILAVILPAGFAIIVLQTYDWVILPRIWYLGTYLFLALLIYGRLNYIKSDRDWKRRRIFVSSEANLDISMGVLIASAALVVLAWTMPLSLSSSPTAIRFWNDLAKPWGSLKQRFNDAFAALHGTVAVGSNDFYTDNLALGLGNPLGDKVLFTVQIPPAAHALPRLYWRGRVYDKYEDGNWTTTARTSDNFNPDNDILSPADGGKGTVGSFVFTTYVSNQSLLYLMPDLLWFSREAEYKYFPVSDKQVDMVLMRTGTNIKAGETFKEQSALANPTVLDLQGAGVEYPDWVTGRYLQLPDNFSPKVAGLAAQITSGMATPYDKAAAITDYLRREIKYVQSIPAAPPHTDPIEWFLFDLKKGFCNYYATAEVLMLRSVGVPARLAVGYAQGEPDKDGVTYYVLEKDAHAWVEVYFPGIGWVEFEPTVSQAPLVRQPGMSESDIIRSGLVPHQPGAGDEGVPAGEQETPEQTAALARPVDYLGMVTWIIIILLIAVAGILLWQSNRRQALAFQVPKVLVASLERSHLPVPHFLINWARWSEQTPIARSFAVVNQSLRWLGKPQSPAATPAERAKVLRELLPEADDEIGVLTTEHQTALYSSRDGNASAARWASQKIRYKTLMRVIRRFLP